MYEEEASLMFWEVRNYGVDRSTLEKMNRSRGAVEFGGADKGRYYVHLEVFHQLHCLVSATLLHPPVKHRS